MGNQTFRATYEAGSWFEIQSLAFSIITRAANGQDTTRSREILKSWGKYGEKYPDCKGYEKATDVFKRLEALMPDGKAVAEKELQVLRDGITKFLHPTIYETTEETPETAKKRGAPVKEGEVSRTTLWRRQQKECQGAMAI